MSGESYLLRGISWITGDNWVFALCGDFDSLQRIQKPDLSRFRNECKTWGNLYLFLLPAIEYILVSWKQMNETKALVLLSTFLTVNKNISGTRPSSRLCRSPQARWEGVMLFFFPTLRLMELSWKKRAELDCRNYLLHLNLCALPRHRWRITGICIAELFAIS